MQQLASDGIMRDEENENSYRNMETAVPSYKLDEDDGEMCIAPSISSSVVSSVMTADGIHDPHGFAIVCLVILVGDMPRGIMFPSMWPLVSSLGGSSVTLGYSVASFSFGRILVSPLFGSWSITHGYTQTLLTSCSILLFGTLAYAQIQNVGRTEFLFLSQILLGIGSGTLGVTRAFVAEVTATRNRTTYMAWVSAVQYAGFTVTPFLGALFNIILADVDVQYGFLRFNLFTAPAYFMSILIMITIFLLSRFFKDRARHQTPKDLKKKSAKRAAIDDHANQLTTFGLTVFDCCILGCMMLNISTKGTIGSFETLGVSMAMSHFGLSASQAGTIVASCGTIGVAALLSMGHLSRFLSDIQLIAGGMLVMALGIMSLTTLDENAENPPWRFIAAIFMLYSVGYPIGHTAVIGLFSKIVGRRPQGTLQGWFASAGSLARLIFPIASGYIEYYLSLTALFYILTGVLMISTFVTFYNQKTLSLLSQ